MIQVVLVIRCLGLPVNTLTQGELAFKAHLKHVIILCGECKLSFCCIFLGVKSVTGGICDLQSSRKNNDINIRQVLK